MVHFASTLLFIAAAAVASVSAVDDCTVDQMTSAILAFASVRSQPSSIACATDSGFDLFGMQTLPTDTMHTKMCKSDACKKMIKATTDTKPPQCMLLLPTSQAKLNVYDFVTGFDAKCTSLSSGTAGTDNSTISDNSTVPTVTSTVLPSTTVSAAEDCTLEQKISALTVYSELFRETYSQACIMDSGVDVLNMQTVPIEIYGKMCKLDTCKRMMKAGIDYKPPQCAFAMIPGQAKLNMYEFVTSFDGKCASLSGGVADAVNSATSAPSLTTTKVPTTDLGGKTQDGGSSHTTLIAVIAAIAVVVVVIGAVLFRRMRNNKSSAHNGNAVNLISKDDASHDNMLLYISSDESLRALRLEQHEVMLSKSLGVGSLWLGELAGTKVVVKRLEAEKSDTRVTKNLLSQAQALAPLKHENVVSLLGVTWLDGTDFALVVEFMDKSSLKQVLADTNWQLSQQAKLRMCMDIAQGLAYLHATERSLYVRAFSSRKVLVNSSSECKLDVLDVYPSATTFEAAESVGVGEIAWLAPEIVTRSSLQDPRKINVYAFGVVMCEILTRTAPYQSLVDAKGDTQSDLEIARCVRRKEPLTPHENHREFMRAPQSLRDVITQCLAYSPSDRPSAGDIIVALQDAKVEAIAASSRIGGDFYVGGKGQ